MAMACEGSEAPQLELDAFSAWDEVGKWGKGLIFRWRRAAPSR